MSGAGPGTGLSRRGGLWLALAGLSTLVLPHRARARGYDGPALIGRPIEYVVKPDETLLDIARRYNLGVPEVSAANPGVDAWVPGAGTRLVLPTAFLLPQGPRAGLLVNAGELRLYFFPADGSVQTFSIGVGREGLNTPLGSTRIVRKQVHPTWYPTADTRLAKPELPAVVPAGPDNPMGDYAMYLGWPTYAVHGTNRPFAVGRRVSRGCIRLYPEGIERLFHEVPLGTSVTVVRETIKVGYAQETWWMQAKPELDQIDELEVTYRLTPKPVDMAAVRGMILARVGEDAAGIDWPVVESELRLRRGVPVPIIAAPGIVAGAPQVVPARDALAAGLQGTLLGLY